MKKGEQGARCLDGRLEAGLAYAKRWRFFSDAMAVTRFSTLIFTLGKNKVKLTVGLETIYD
ncbi:MAG: hypothetical protein HQL27_04095 [Candidatus Omnitrophica bacterium]|nr:hypothetical protein [Candidatus Omnitrophota bacterium]